MAGHGVLVLVVGPSGAGKDTIIDGARARLRDDARFSFPRGVVTRPAGSGGEDHLTRSEDEFAATEREGGFLLSWRAHGLACGVPASASGDLAAGWLSSTYRARSSRRLWRASRRCGWRWSRRPPRTLAERLAGRCRESAAAIEERLARAAAVPVEAPHVAVFESAGPVNVTVDRFVEFVTGLAGNAPVSADDKGL